MVTEFQFPSCPHAWRLVSIGIGGFRRTSRRSQSKVSGSYFKQHWSRKCGHSAQNLLVLRSLQFSFTLAACGHKSAQMICVFLGYVYKRRSVTPSQSKHWRYWTCSTSPDTTCSMLNWLIHNIQVGVCNHWNGLLDSYFNALKTFSTRRIELYTALYTALPWHAKLQ